MNMAVIRHNYEELVVSIEEVRHAIFTYVCIHFMGHVGLK